MNNKEIASLIRKSFPYVSYRTMFSGSIVKHEKYAENGSRLKLKDFLKDENGERFKCINIGSVLVDKYKEGDILTVERKTYCLNEKNKVVVVNTIEKVYLEDENCNINEPVDYKYVEVFNSIDNENPSEYYFNIDFNGLGIADSTINAIEKSLDLKIEILEMKKAKINKIKEKIKR